MGLLIFFILVIILVPLLQDFLKFLKEEEIKEKQQQEEERRKAEEARQIAYQRKQEYIKQQKIAFVKSNSQCIRKIEELNKKCDFKDVKQNPKYKISCNSKQQFDNFNIDNYMLLSIEDSPEFFIQMVKKTHFNRSKYPQYENMYKNILYNFQQKCNYEHIVQGQNITASEFKAIEIQECNNIKLNPTRDFIMTLIVCYTSPQNVNSYENSYEFDCSEIEQYIQDFKDAEKNKESAIYQRQLMTPKLRYQIMKRDNFKCTICGRSQNDGAKLHVDHIMPVSKGGKTEESNLRTLCDLCNLGKGALYDPNGIN